ncbi:MAG: MBOAT family protein, partial [Clostridiales bacterium]|nr:MBOAT family protein [Candidatus Crickella merdequi]
AEHTFDYDKFCRGLQLMVWGYFKKLVIADRLAVAVTTVFDGYTAGNFNGLQTLIAIIAYAIQIYTDFSGGIDIIRGAAEAMGIELEENFNRPYFGNSVAEHWRRWHMSLTGWMRDYVFYSLALSKLSNRIGKWGRKTFKGHVGKQMPTFLPTFTTFFLIGIWHGAGLGFIVYGFYNAIIIVASQMLQPIYDKANSALHINDQSFLWKVWQIVRTFFIMTIGRCFTRAESVGVALQMVANGLHFFGNSFSESMMGLGMQKHDLIMAVIAVIVLFIVSVIQERGVVIRDALAEKSIALRWVVLIAGILSIAVFGVYGIGYNASAFIYNGF